jgi:AraC-like DNA-binding protein
MKSSWISVRALLEAAELAGVERDQLRRLAGIDASEMHDVYGWVDGERFDRLLCGAVELSGSPVFGLEWGEKSPMVQLELIPLLVANAPTLGRCVDMMVLIQSLLHERPLMEVETEGRQVALRFTPDASFTPVAARVLTDYMMSGIRRLLAFYTRGAVDASYSFQHQADTHVGDYTRVFGARVTFAAERNAAVFSAEHLKFPHEHHNADLFEALLKHVELLRARISSKLSYTDRVKAELRAALPRLLEMAEAASLLGMSERSLRRRLADEGTSFSDVVERGQIELASELLSHPNASVKGVAYQLGFDTSSGFHRAFKRWTGKSPAAFRLAKGRGSGG